MMHMCMMSISIERKHDAELKTRLVKVHLALKCKTGWM